MVKQLRTRLLFCVVLLAAAMSPLMADDMPQAEGPVILSSAGQSPGATMLKLMMKRSGIGYDYLQVATLEQIKSKGYKTLVLAMGTSLKGMGAAGIDFNSEMDRIQTLIDYAHENDILVIGFHIEGQSRRGGYDEQLINKFVPQLDGLVVRSDGNSDGIFTELTRKNGIPMKEIEKTIELGTLLKSIF